MNAYYFYHSQRLLIWLGLCYISSPSCGMFGHVSSVHLLFFCDEFRRGSISRESHVFYIHITFRLFRAMHLNLKCLYYKVRKLQLFIGTKLSPPIKIDIIILLGNCFYHIEIFTINLRNYTLTQVH